MIGLFRGGMFFVVAVSVCVPAVVSAAAERCGSRVRGESGRYWRSVAPGLEFSKARIRFEDGTATRMNGARIDPARFKIRLWWQAEKNFPSAADKIARQARASVVANAGYFDENGRPLGYFRSADTNFNSRLLFRGRRRALHLGAVFYVRKDTGKVGITTREDFDPAGVGEAFQAGPYLVRGGRPDPGLEAYREFRRADRRTVLAIGKKGRLIFMVSEEIGRGISWCELQNFLSRPEAEGGLDVAEAMNLDGGSSSQLFVRENEQSHYLTGRIVPALILAVPRGTGGGS